MSVTSVPGFVAAGVAGGIKAAGLQDVALVATGDGRPVPAAGVFTSNLAAAAPVQVSRAHLEATGGRAAAVIINSGNANAATGAPGREDAVRMATLVSEGIGCARQEVLVCSTGLIGYRLPMEAVEAGVAAALRARSARGGADAARAMMTTDTRPKEVVVAGDGFSVGGIAKGAAMLAPDMATMLAVLTTDAAVDPGDLRTALQCAVGESFNRLSVDGCASTNDTVLVLASGAAGARPLDAVRDSLTEACASLAGQMAQDAEGATRIAVVTVTGAADDTDAARAARRVAESQLFQCSLHGADPYWGRVVSELGSSGAAFDIDRVSVSYGGVAVCLAGVAADHDEAAVAAHVAGRRVDVSCDLGLGPGRAAILTTDLSPAYIAENQGTS